MQVRIGIYALEYLLHGLADAHLVDEPHVEDLDARFVHEPLLSCVHTANADQSQVSRVERGHVAANGHEITRTMATQARYRHAVDVSGWCECGRVEVRVRVEPQHAKPLLLLAAVAGNGAYGADAHAVVSA